MYTGHLTGPGLDPRWRFDRMATVSSPTTGTVSAAFAQAAKRYAVGVDLCPPGHGNRKGVAEKANHSAVQRWWRTVADDATVAAAGCYGDIGRDSTALQ